MDTTKREENIKLFHTKGDEKMKFILTLSEKYDLFKHSDMG